MVEDFAVERRLLKHRLHAMLRDLSCAAWGRFNRYPGNQVPRRRAIDQLSMAAVTPEVSQRNGVIPRGQTTEAGTTVHGAATGPAGKILKHEIANQVNQVRDADAKMSVSTGSTEERP